MIRPTRSSPLLIAALLALTAPALVTSVTHATENKASAPTKETNSKVDITADNMEVREKDNLIIFTGHVVAKKEDTTLYADRLEVHTEKEKQPDGSEKDKVRFLDATGHVRIVKPDMTITGEKAHMDVKKDMATVTGSVVVKKPDATIRGDKLIANLKTNVTHIVSAGRRRVHSVFTKK